jgi:hypothetical protein
MATELPRPGVEVVQQFQSASPTIVSPTLVPCVVAPFFEIIEALNSDGTVNDSAKLASNYQQLKLTVAQSSFPSPRGNIDEVDVLEETIRGFFQFGGDLIEVSQSSAFLRGYLDPSYSTQPYVDGTTAEPVGGYAIDGRTLIFQFDSHTSVVPGAAHLPVSANITITFAAAVAGGNLTLAEVIAQINAVVPGVALNSGSDELRLRSTNYGSQASVVVRKEGSANAVADGLGFSAADDTLSVGGGLYASDDSDSDLTSPRLKFSGGSQQVLLASYPGTVWFVAPNFISDAIEVGDNVIADGVNIGQVATVESDTLTMEVEQNLHSHDNTFAPRRVWVQANNLSYPAPAASAAATVTGTQAVAAESSAFIVAQAVGTFAIGASETFDVNIVKDGVALATQTVSSGAGWADLAEAITGINATVGIEFEAYYSNDVGDEIDAVFAAANPTLAYVGLRTLADNRGSDASISLVDQTVGMTLGFSSLPVADIGENKRYLPGTYAIATTSAPLSSTAGTETVIYAPTVKGVVKSAETVALGVNATLAAIVADWNTKAAYTEAYKSTVAGVESASGTYLSIRSRGENVGTTAVIDITTDATPVFGVASHAGANTSLVGENFKWSTDLNPREYEILFIADEDDGGVSLQQVIDKINALTPNVASESSSSPPELKLTSQKVGVASEIEILDASDANTALGFTDDTAYTGSGRPDPDMAVDITGAVVWQGQLLRDGLTGLPFNPGFAPALITYKGLRLDLSPEADNPGLVTFDDVTSLEAAAGPISSDNPGAALAYLALLNAPTVSVSAIGVPEVSADAPDGTPAGYTVCAEYLENKEVYALATASQNPVVHQTFLTHVNAMSAPEQKGERIYFFNAVTPDRANPTLVASGTDANSTANANEVTVEVNLAAALIANGIDPNVAINPTTGEIVEEVYFDRAGDDKKYLVQAVSGGTTIQLRTSFASGDGNDDAFFSDEALPSGVISDSWTVYIRGQALLVPGTTTPDKNAIAETMQVAAQAYGFRRGFWVFPDQVGINITGLEQLVEGYYATSAIAGMVGQQPPQQGFTNFPIAGLTKVQGSNDRFTNSQLNVIAAGGVYILVQDAVGAPIVARHQLSTDTTSIEARELSITKAVDYCAKFIRVGMRNFMGRSNITQAFLDNLAGVLEGLLAFLVDNGAVIGASPNNLIQDADNPDSILVDVTLDVAYPANFLRVVLIV